MGALEEMLATSFHHSQQQLMEGRNSGKQTLKSRSRMQYLKINSLHQGITALAVVLRESTTAMLVACGLAQLPLSSQSTHWDLVQTTIEGL